jgi:hypothetical protein
LEHHDRVQAFQRQRRTGLVALPFTEIDGSARLKPSPPGCARKDEPFAVWPRR